MGWSHLWRKIKPAYMAPTSYASQSHARVEPGRLPQGRGGKSSRATAPLQKRPYPQCSPVMLQPSVARGEGLPLQNLMVKHIHNKRWTFR